MNDTNIDNINIIVDKLHNSIEAVKVYRWLENFDVNDRNDMLKLLMYHEHITSNMIFESYVNKFEQIISSYDSNTELVIHPIGKYEKSGTAMIYYVNKAVSALDHKNVKYAETVKELTTYLELEKSKDMLLVLVDDIFGSGGSAVKYYNNVLEPINVEIFKKLIFVSVVALEDGVKNILDNVNKSEVIAEYKRTKLFRINELYNNDIEYRNYVRNISYKYGKKLNPKGPLGYENSQALISFPYSTPNNTLPIVWASEHEWYPLHERFISDRLSFSRMKRKEIAYMMGFMSLYGVNELFNYQSFDRDGKRKYGRHNFLLISVLNFLYKSVDTPIILQLLSINESLYNQIIIELEEKEFVENGTISTKGKKYLSAIYFSFENFDELKFNKKEPKFSNVSYKPKSFGGYSDN